MVYNYWYFCFGTDGNIFILKLVLTLVDTGINITILYKTFGGVQNCWQEFFLVLLII